jgi:hypothetical protein
MTRPFASSDEITSTMPLRSRTPPSLIGRVTNGMSSTLAGGYSRPLLGHRAVRWRWRPAVDSIDGFEPSRKLLNIFGLRPPRWACLRREAVVCPQTVSGVDSLKCGSHFVAAPCGGDREAAGAGPVDQVADQRRLVAEGERVDDAGLGRLCASSGPQKAVGLDGDVDTCLPCANAARQCSTAAIGWPVHSTMHSMAG